MRIATRKYMMRIVSIGSVDFRVKTLGCNGCSKKKTGAGDFGFGFGEERA